MFAFIAQLFRYGSFLARTCCPDVVITSSTYPLANIAAHRIANKAKAKLIYEVRDLWPLTLVELQGMSRWNPFVLLMQWAENFSYRKADHVTCTLANAASHMIEHGMEPAKFAYIPNGSAASEWKKNGSVVPEEHLTALSDLKREGKFLLGYTGSHGISNALDVFLEAAAVLNNKDIAFVFVGQGPEKQALIEKSLRRKLTNVIFLPPVPKSSIPPLLEMMDGCFIGWQKKAFYRFGISPNKLVDYMMAGKPVIQAAEVGGDLVAQSNCGFSVPPENPAAVAEAITTLISLPRAERDAMGVRGREYVHKHQEYRSLARQYLKIMQ
jgi:glycosyltransferase involved in cell wall biosynthesis